MKKSGFGLIEILVSMALAFILVTGTAELITYSLWAKKKGDLTSGLAQAASARLEALKALPFDSETLRPASGSVEFTDSLSRERILQTWTIEEAGEEMKRIVLVTRPLDNIRSGLKLVLYLSKNLGFRP